MFISNILLEYPNNENINALSGNYMNNMLLILRTPN